MGVVFVAFSPLELSRLHLHSELYPCKFVPFFITLQRNITS